MSRPYVHRPPTPRKKPQFKKIRGGELGGGELLICPMDGPYKGRLCYASLAREERTPSKIRVLVLGSEGAFTDYWSGTLASVEFVLLNKGPLLIDSSAYMVKD